MSYIASIGTSQPEFNMKQTEVKDFIKNIFPRPEKELDRLMPVFENAHVANRQFVVSKAWFSEQHSFVERNRIYQEKTLQHSLEAIDKCLSSKENFHDPIPYEAIDSFVFVSSTGISTPSMDAHIVNKRSFRDDITRIPLWGLGCAGGASGLARGHEWLEANNSGVTLIVCAELCSLTFQKDDERKSNFIGSALFGDGISAALMIGDKSEYRHHIRQPVPKVKAVSSRLKKQSLDVMGWEIAPHGFEVIFAKSIPRLVETFWKEHVDDFMEKQGTISTDYGFFIAHPGGKKVLNAIEKVLDVSEDSLQFSYQVLHDHGNMSSCTVLYILKEWMKNGVEPGEKSIVSALGPGFSSELLEVEWSG